MVKRDSSKEAFTTRLLEACQLAELKGHGRNKQLADMLKKAGVKVSTPGVWKWFNAQAIPDAENILALSRVLAVRAEWLEYGVGEPRESSEVKSVISPSSKDVYRVEVLDLSVSAGPGSYMLSDYVEVLYAIEFTTEHARSLFGNRSHNDVKVMTVNGDSMAPTLVSGDRLFVDISVRHFQTDGVYSFVFGKTFHVKRLQMQGDRLAVLSDNPAYEKWYINEDNQDRFYVMGKALIHESIKYNRL
ncbi:helix-turn-helix transcriptional regulator [Enterobacter hormaechei]|uniref:helix-turn-helix transcriptional regulator n=1 Tax=Enterobacter hormaechei TaxID=158836 RepID=UPI00254DEB18|nr:helix-turn-helix transcriptional regulator [Enterobacter hormaechei]MDK9634287.1 helix-turn-helix transcriptional regulator [Enterobacter hormaechei]